MASYTLSKKADTHIRELIEARQWRHKAIELAAHELLQVLDKKAGIA